MPEGCPEELALGSKDLAMLQYPVKPDEAAHVCHPWRSQERGSLRTSWTSSLAGCALGSVRLSRIRLTETEGNT